MRAVRGGHSRGGAAEYKNNPMVGDIIDIDIDKSFCCHCTQAYKQIYHSGITRGRAGMVISEFESRRDLNALNLPPSAHALRHRLSGCCFPAAKSEAVLAASEQVRGES